MSMLAYVHTYICAYVLACMHARVPGKLTGTLAELNLDQSTAVIVPSDAHAPILQNPILHPSVLSPYILILILHPLPPTPLLHHIPPLRFPQPFSSPPNP